MTRSGGMPNFSSTPRGSRTVSVIVLTRVTLSVTSCAMSLSPVDTITGQPASAAWRARVPMTSSASTPGSQSRGNPIAPTMSWMGCTCSRRSSGIGGRWAL